MEITKQALMALKNIYKKGFSYKKAGVIVGDIVPENSKQLSLFSNKDSFKVKSIMCAVDHINQKMGRNKIRLAVQGFDRKWRLKQEKLSPCYTTRFSDVLEVKV
jgi:DNA polymerase V